MSRPLSFPHQSIPRDIYSARNVGWRVFEFDDKTPSSFEPIVSRFRNPASRARLGKTPHNAIRALAVNNRDNNGSVAFSAHGLTSRDSWITRQSIKPKRRRRRKTYASLVALDLPPKPKPKRRRERNLNLQWVDYLMWLETIRERLSRATVSRKRQSKYALYLES
jgi:hypothetical protein